MSIKDIYQWMINKRSCVQNIGGFGMVMDEYKKYLNKTGDYKENCIIL